MHHAKVMVIVVVALAVVVVLLTPLPGAWAASKEQVLYNFNNNGTDGEGPAAGLIFDTMCGQDSCLAVIHPR